MRTTIAAAALAVAGVVAMAPPTAAASPYEDEPGWSCVDDGNRVCGPGNPEGKPAACYDEGGVIVALWPCHSVSAAGGSNAYDAGAYVGGYN
jgi:hypothetical protein